MGSPKKAIRQFTQTAEDAVNDISKGVEQMAQGNVEQGFINTSVGLTNMGLTETGLTPFIPVEGETALTRKAKDAAGQAEQDAAAAAEGKENDRKDRIKNRLDEEIKLRQRQPGRAQTLLTTGMTPSASQTNTLLTSAVRGMR